MTNCASCGRFMNPGSPGTRHFFEPASHFGPEVNEWTCAQCTGKTNGNKKA